MRRAPIPLLAALAMTITGCATSGRVAPPASTAGAAPSQPQAPSATLETVTLPLDSPIVSIRLLFRAGSVADPPGEEGLAALTGLMLAEAGSSERSYAELTEALYPMASTIEVRTDREVTLIEGETHRDNLEEYTDLLLELLLSPGFRSEDFERNRQQLSSYLTNTLRAGSDELLGLEALQDRLFAGHPYGHPPQGTVQGLAALTIGDVEAFYRQHFTRGNLMLGVAGGYPEGYVERLAERLSALPASAAASPELPPPPSIDGRRFTLIDKPTASVGIHFGYPLELTWADDDYYALMVANSFLGEHRTFHGVLMQQLRGLRGLNYGDYSYIEYYHLPPFTSSPTPNVPRRQQYFSVWVRPVVPATAHFALRAALHYTGELVRNGMTQEQFELARGFLINYSKLWAQSQSRRLGFLMDSRYYGSDPYIEEIESRLRALSLDEVNDAIRRYLQLEDFEAVVVTDGAAELAGRLEADAPSPIEYESAVPPEVEADDGRIEELRVAPDAIEIVPVAEMFER